MLLIVVQYMQLVRNVTLLLELTAINNQANIQIGLMQCLFEDKNAH